jgi:hypothetical protein
MGCCGTDTIDLVQYDTKPVLDLVLYDPLTELPFDVSDVGTLVYFMIRKQATLPYKEAILTQKLPGTVDDNGVVAFPPAYNVPGSGGRVEVHWTVTALDTYGQFEGELIVVYGDTTRQTSIQTVKLNIKPAWGGVPVAGAPTVPVVPGGDLPDRINPLRRPR